LKIYNLFLLLDVENKKSPATLNYGMVEVEGGKAIT
jgi:hypothetical protein